MSAKELLSLLLQGGGLIAAATLVLKFLAHRQSVQRAKRSEIEKAYEELNRVRGEYREERDKWRAFSEELSRELERVKQERFDYERKLMQMERERDQYRDERDEYKAEVDLLKARVFKLEELIKRKIGDSDEKITPLPENGGRRVSE